VKITSHLPFSLGKEAPTPALKRIGRFRIIRDMLETEPDSALCIFEGILILRAEHLLSEDVVEYVAISKHFEPCPSGCEAPLYEATIYQTGNVVQQVEWNKVS